MCFQDSDDAVTLVLFISQELFRDMQLFRFWSFIILPIFLRLSASFVYYFLKDGTDKVQVTDLRHENTSNVNVIVIDFLFPYYLEIIGDPRPKGEMRTLHIYLLIYYTLFLRFPHSNHETFIIFFLADLPKDYMPPSGYIMYHWLVEGPPKVTCFFTRVTGFECRHVGRMVVIEGKSLQYDFQMFGHCKAAQKKSAANLKWFDFNNF